MKKYALRSGIGASIGMLILILDGKTALEGARQGLDLCLRTVIPSLFPFFFLSGILTGAFLGMRSALLRPFGRLCRIPDGAESLLLVGLLGGYPVGAQCVASAWRGEQLSRSNAERMLAFCSNAGPAFLFGIVASMFSDSKTVWILWGIHILSALLTGILLPGGEMSPAKISSDNTFSLPEPLSSALKAIGSVCGWIILFRVMIAFLERWILWLLPLDVQIMIIGLLELSNGCCELNSIANPSARFLICSGILAFGGLCVTMQTLSVTKGLSLRYYFPGKVLQTVLSLALAAAYLLDSFLPCCVIISLSLLILQKIRKKSSIPQTVGV